VFVTFVKGQTKFDLTFKLRTRWNRFAYKFCERWSTKLDDGVTLWMWMENANGVI